MYRVIVLLLGIVFASCQAKPEEPAPESPAKDEVVESEHIVQLCANALDAVRDRDIDRLADLGNQETRKILEGLTSESSPDETFMAMMAFVGAKWSGRFLGARLEEKRPRRAACWFGNATGQHAVLTVVELKGRWIFDDLLRMSDAEWEAFGTPIPLNEKWQGEENQGSTDVTPIPPEDLAVGERTVELLVQVRDIGTQNKDNCEEMGVALKAFSEKHAEELWRTRAAYKALPKERRSRVETALSGRLTGLKDAKQLIGKCLIDRNVATSIKELFPGQSSPSIAPPERPTLAP